MKRSGLKTVGFLYMWCVDWMMQAIMVPLGTLWPHSSSSLASLRVITGTTLCGKVTREKAHGRVQHQAPLLGYERKRQGPGLGPAWVHGGHLTDTGVENQPRSSRRHEEGPLKPS